MGEPQDLSQLLTEVKNNLHIWPSKGLLQGSLTYKPDEFKLKTPLLFGDINRMLSTGLFGTQKPREFILHLAQLPSGTKEFLQPVFHSHRHMGNYTEVSLAYNPKTTTLAPNTIVAKVDGSAKVVVAPAPNGNEVEFFITSMEQNYMASFLEPPPGYLAMNAGTLHMTNPRDKELRAVLAVRWKN